MAPLIPIIGLIGAVAGGVVAVGGGIAAKKQGKAQAQLAEQSGEIGADRARREGRRSIADRAARFGASGVVVGTGSTLDVLADEAAEVEEQALVRAFSGDIGASGLRGQAGLALATGIVTGIGSFGTAAGFGLQAADIIGRDPLGTSPITVPSPLIGPPTP